MAAKGPDSLEQRVREGASGFEFHALVKQPNDDERASRPQSMEEKFESYLSSRGEDQPSSSDRQPSITELPGRSPDLSKTAAAVVSALAVLALGGWGLFLRQSDTPRAGASSVAAAAPAVVSQPEPKPTDARIGLPRADLTPGERSPRPTIGVSVPETVRRQVFTSYGIDPEDTRHVAVRLIPAAFGGTNGAKNVFPVTPWFAGLKARLDAYLIGEVRAGKMTPAQAEAELTSDWIKSCHRHYIRNYGELDADKARKTEDQLRWE